MVQVVYGSSDDFDSLVYGQNHPSTMQYLQNQFQNISQTLTDAGRNFFSNASELYNQFNGADALRAARAATRKVSSIFQRDEIRCIWDLGGLQHAPLTMQRWIMAEPTIRELYQEQRCEGYSGTYTDMHPKTIGENHYDYRRVMHGLMTDTEEADWKISFFLDELVEGDRVLSLDEQIDITTTWAFVKARAEAGDRDPTSPADNAL